MHRRRVRLCAAALVLSPTFAAPLLANQNAADSTNADVLWGRGLTGAGVTVGVWEAYDGGDWMVRNTHEAFRSYNPATGLWDGPSRVTFGDTPDTGSSPYSSHGTHVAGTIAGAHIPGKELYWGMAPAARVVSYNVGGDYTEMQRDHRNSVAIDITNHSYGYRYGLGSDQTWNIPQEGGGTTALTYRTFGYGSSYYRDVYDEDPRYGRYGSVARSLDTTLFNNPKLLSFWSAGNERSNADNNYTNHQGDNKYVARFSPGFTPTNGVSLGNNYWLVSRSDYAWPGLKSGYDSLAGDKMSKNAVIVGAVGDYTTDPHPVTTSGISTTGFSSYGPTDDGRLGVTLVANGDGLRSANNSSDTAYASKNGTSMSSPNAAGAAALLLEHWRGKLGGATPNAATQKGLLVHTATDVQVNNSNVTLKQIGPDYRTGYGLLNAEAAALFIDDATKARPTAFYFEQTITQGTSFSLDLIATGGPAKATLIWNDPAWTGTHTGQDDRRPTLVNDLDLLLTDALGTAYFPWTLNPESPNLSALRTTANRLDNIEQVYVDAAAAGLLFTLDLTHFGLLTGGLQDYSLLLSGFTIIPEPAAAVALLAGLALAARVRRPSSV